jgi:leucyl/phenylalanyl-tRNA---protein transferase
VVSQQKREATAEGLDTSGDEGTLAPPGGPSAASGEAQADTEGPRSVRQRLRNARERLLEEAQVRIVRGQVLLRKVRDRGGSKAQRLLGAASTRLPPNPLGALCGVADELPLSPEQVVLGYSQGLFPMDFGGRLRWHCPEPRFVLYLSELRLSPKMRRDLRKSDYTFSFDRAPREVLDQCADRPEGTWLSERLKGIFLQLFEMGAMHSVEAWEGSTLIGGSFGLSIGRVWTGETMFHRAPNAGKAQFAFLADHLQQQGYVCVDGQAYSNHFARFGAREISLAEYRKVMARGLIDPARFTSATAAQNPTALNTATLDRAAQDAAAQNTAAQNTAAQNTAAQATPGRKTSVRPPKGS